MERDLELKNLLEISRDLASTLDLNSLLQKIVKAAAEMTLSEAASILLYDDKKNELKFKAASNQNSIDKLIEMIVPKESIAGWVAENKEPLFVPDVHSDPRFYDKVEKNLDFVTKSIIAIPLITKDKLIGVLEVINKKETNFSEGDLELLETLGAQAAVAIENSRLFEQSDAIADLVHELRTPLASIKTIAYLLKKQAISDDHKDKLLITIQNEASRLNDLITNFLDISKMEAGRLSFNYTAFDFESLVNECLLMFYPLAQQKHITIKHVLPSNETRIEGDRKKIKQVLINLISNAIKYNHENGLIQITYFIRENRLIFSIEDTGIGIPTQDLNKIFTKFYRSGVIDPSIQGTGLGLTISKQIIENHGGEIFVESKEDTGSTFYIQLPLVQKLD